MRCCRAQVAGSSMRQYQAILNTYASKANIDPTGLVGIGMLQSFGALTVGTKALHGAVTPQSIITAMKTMTNAVLPGSGGRFFHAPVPGHPQHLRQQSEHRSYWPCWYRHAPELRSAHRRHQSITRCGHAAVNNHGNEDDDQCGAAGLRWQVLPCASTRPSSTPTPAKRT